MNNTKSISQTPKFDETNLTHTMGENVKIYFDFSKGESMYAISYV